MKLIKHLKSLAHSTDLRHRAKAVPRAWALAFCFSISLVSGGFVHAQQLNVVTRHIEPFSFEKDRARTGYSIELWELISRELKIDSNFTVVPSANRMVATVKNKQADVAVGALSITADREKSIDFSQPFFESGLQVLVPKKPAGTAAVLGSILSNIFTWQLVAGVGVALSVMFIISHLVWKYEHPVNEEMWPKTYRSGLGESFWWTISIFLVGGADNKGPVGTGGRIVATVWMFASVVAVSLLTASLSAALTVNALPGEINGPDDLYGKSVATIEGSTAESWLTGALSGSGETIKVQLYPDVPSSLAALNNGKVKAVVYDSPILHYYAKKLGPDKFELVGNLFQKSNYGFGLQNNSALREPINQVMLRLNEEGVIDELKAKWFGSEK